MSETTQFSKILKAVQMGTAGQAGGRRPTQARQTSDELKNWLVDIDSSMAFCPASALVISCGTVTLDLALGKVLVIWNHRIGIYQLPKGRRNIGESMLTAAIRETYEETGVRVQPLQLNVATRATVPADEQDEESRRKNPGITEGQLSNEFVSTCLYPDPQSETEALKIIFYFAATADSTLAPQAGAQEDWEKLRGEWVPISEVANKLQFKAEMSAVLKTLADTSKTGYTIGTMATGTDIESNNGDRPPGAIPSLSVHYEESRQIVE